MMQQQFDHSHWNNCHQGAPILYAPQSPIYYHAPTWNAVGFNQFNGQYLHQVPHFPPLPVYWSAQPIFHQQQHHMAHCLPYPIQPMPCGFVPQVWNPEMNPSEHDTNEMGEQKAVSDAVIVETAEEVDNGNADIAPVDGLSKEERAVLDKKFPFHEEARVVTLTANSFPDRLKISVKAKKVTKKHEVFIQEYKKSVQSLPVSILKKNFAAKAKKYNSRVAKRLDGLRLEEVSKLDQLSLDS